jgi:hypothetical protein
MSGNEGGHEKQCELMYIAIYYGDKPRVALGYFLVVFSHHTTHNTTLTTLVACITTRYETCIVCAHHAQ